MSEKNTAPVVETGTNEEPQVENNEVSSTEEEGTTPEPTGTGVSPVDEKARAHGWKPLEEYDGDPDKWVDAKEFLRRGELFEKIDHLSRDLKDTKKALRALQVHHSNVREVEYKRALEELRAEKKSAYEQGDTDKLIEIDERLTDLKAAQKAEEAAARQMANKPDPRFLAWVEDNSWYAQDAEMRALADQVGTAYAANNPDLDPSEVLKYVSKRVKVVFKDKFQNPNRTKPSAVESAGRPVSKKVDNFELSEDEKRVMNTFIRQGIMTKEQYIEDLKKVRG